MIRLNVILSIEKTSQAEFFKTVNHLVEESKKEAGCIFYDFFKSTTDDELFMFCETWESEEALSLHKETAHFKEDFPILLKLSKIVGKDAFHF